MAYTNIDDPSAYFQTALWTGNNATGNQITNDGNSDLQPDLIWAKARTSTPYTDNHFIVDSSRGRLKGLVPNDTSAETTTTGNESQQAERDLESFDTDGFTVGIVNSTAALNASSASNVAWQWKANGGTTSSNTDGSITSTVQANQDAGFSIVTYTGTGANATVGHGLGVTPNIVFYKNRIDSGITGSTNGNWIVQSSALNVDEYIKLNEDAPAATDTGYFRSTRPSSTVLTLGNYNSNNGSSDNLVAYCFAPIQGYSKFGKYVGNGNANGPFVYTGFKPAFVMVKPTSNSGYNWVIMDSARNPTNTIDKYIWGDLADVEYDGTGIGLDVDFLSNGFKLTTARGEVNLNTATNIYMAFAENPFVTSTGIPTTAR